MGSKSTELLPTVLEYVKRLEMRKPNFNKFIEDLAVISVAPLQALECLLSAYVTNNFVGPPSDLPLDLSQMDDLAYKYLSIDGETPFPLVRNLSLLWFCKEFSWHMITSSKIMAFFYAVIHMKSIYLYQNIYGETRCPSIKADLDELLKHVELNDLAVRCNQDCLSFCLLGCFMAAFYYDFNLAHRFKELCESLLGLKVQFSAELGTRTKAQENPLSQLILVVERTDAANSFHSLSDGSTAQPKVCPLEDDNLLDFIRFVDVTAAADPKLSVPEQAFVLCSGELHRRSHPHDDLIDEQSLTYVTAVVRAVAGSDKNKVKDDGASESVPRNAVSWPILTEALFKRGSYERQSLARTERAIRQLEEIAAQFSSPVPETEQRGVQHFFWSRMPSQWQIELSLARVLTKIGSIKSALDIYLRWQQWDEIISSYTSLGKRDLAEKVIRERIASGCATPELYCCLGDVTSDMAHYRTAWELSKHRSVRAVRSLGYYAFRKDKNVKKAAECFEAALEINRFQVNLWFTLGCCYLQLHDFPQAERAFRYCVTLEPDNFEAWNNLASAVIFSGRRAQSLALLKEATKWNFDSWRIWENILLVGMDEGSFGDVISAYHRLIDLRQKHIDSQVLGMLTKAVSENLPDSKNCGAARYRKDLLTLFGRVTATNPSDADTWRYYANLILNSNAEAGPVQFQRAVQYIQRSYQCRLRSATPDWEFDKTAREDLLADLQAMAKLLIPTGCVDNFTSDPEMKLFITSALSSLRMNINLYIARLKHSGTIMSVVQSIFRATAGNIWSPSGGRRFFASVLSPFVPCTTADFHQLGCAKFIQRMRQNLIERNSEANLDEMLSLYQRLQNGEKDLQSRIEHLYLSLPNFSHPSTPVGDPSKFRLLHLHGSPKLIPRPKNEVDLLSNEFVPHRCGNRARRTGHGTLRSSGALVAGCGSRAYAFYDSLAVLEAALLQLTLNRTREAGFQLIAVPDLLLSSVIQRCGFPTTGDRSQIFNIAERKGSGVGNETLFSLSGTAEMALAAFCADRVFGEVGTAEAEFFCAVSRCFRHEIAPQESLLYRTHQFTKVEIFCVTEPSPEVGDKVFERIVEFQKKLYSDLELHFRVLEMPTSELGNSAHRKIDIEALMPGEGIFGEFLEMVPGELFDIIFWWSFILQFSGVFTDQVLFRHGNEEKSQVVYFGSSDFEHIKLH